MTDDTARGEPADRPLRTFADKLDWLIEHAHPAGRGPFTNAEVAALVGQVSGEKISYNAVWQLRTGKTINPTKRVIEALAQTFGVPPGFFFDDYDEAQARVLADQVELLALIRDASIDHMQLRAFLGMPPEIRGAITSLIEYTAQAEADGKRRQRGPD
jgi:transcriptional regulator with XRE-family HTH domain